MATGLESGRGTAGATANGQPGPPSPAAPAPDHRPPPLQEASTRRIGLLTCALLAPLAAAPALAQRTLHIPQEQIDALPDPRMPERDIDPSSPDGVIRSMEGIAGADWTGALPEDLAALFGASPIAAHVPVVWEVRATGELTERISGQGTATVLDLGAMGQSGRQVHALLDSPTRDRPLQVLADLPAGGDGIARRRFSGTGTPAAAGVTGLGATTNQLFQPGRRLGHATAQGMCSSDVLPMLPRYLHTRMDGGHVHVHDRDGRLRLAF